MAKLPILNYPFSRPYQVAADFTGVVAEDLGTGLYQTSNPWDSYKKAWSISPVPGLWVNNIKQLYDFYTRVAMGPYKSILFCEGRQFRDIGNGAYSFDQEVGKLDLGRGDGLTTDFTIPSYFDYDSLRVYVDGIAQESSEMVPDNIFHPDLSAFSTSTLGGQVLQHLPLGYHRLPYAGSRGVNTGQSIMLRNYLSYNPTTPAAQVSFDVSFANTNPHTVMAWIYTPSFNDGVTSGVYSMRSKLSTTNGASVEVRTDQYTERDFFFPIMSHFTPSSTGTHTVSLDNYYGYKIGGTERAIFVGGFSLKEATYELVDYLEDEQAQVLRFDSAPVAGAKIEIECSRLTKARIMSEQFRIQALAGGFCEPDNLLLLEEIS